MKNYIKELLKIFGKGIIGGLGILFVFGIVYAVNSGEPLTSTMWNTLVTRVDNLELNSSKIEMASFQVANASTLVSNNSGYVSLSQHVNGPIFNPDVFEIVNTGNYGIKIKKDGYISVDLNQDIKSTGTTGYLYSTIYLNGTLKYRQLITNTNGQRDAVVNGGTLSVNAGDVIEFHYYATDITGLDSTYWGQYNFIWSSK